ncbi:MAG: outer membrane protein assembly factor BamD [Dysgonamonadaceae bacterium]|jgi:outer membrane protein assembly factor BamD|nr:outer membrane protein assembly factor BamD [Dysgonamonadaceae bacterium]
MKSGNILLIIISLLLLSCGEYNKVLKSTDYNTKLSYAKTCFEQGKFSRAATLLEDMIPIIRNTAKGEEALHLIAQCYYNMKDYQTAAEYFKSYFTSYPTGKNAESAHYLSAYSLYLNSPNPQLDQTDTYKSIRQFQTFLDLYPTSENKESAQTALFELQDKLAYKELLSVKLYYNLGEYLLIPFPGGNYLSCVITAQNAIRDYPFSKYREDFMYYMLKSKYEIAVKSVDEKKEYRYRDVVDEYFSYINEFPEGKYLKEIKKFYSNIEKELNN